MNSTLDPQRRVRPESTQRARGTHRPSEHLAKRPYQDSGSGDSKPGRSAAEHRKTRAAAEGWIVLTRTPRRRKVLAAAATVLALMLVWALMMNTASRTRAHDMENQMVNLCNLALSERLSTTAGNDVQIAPNADLTIDKLSDGVRLTTRVNTDEGTEAMRCTAYFAEGSTTKIGAVDVYLGQ